MRLTLDAPVKKTRVRSITAVLPGKSDEVVIVDSHTDGQNFVEENGAVALVHLARHFASLPPGQRLERTLVFVAWPGHMAGTLPQAPGWVAAHPRHRQAGGRRRHHRAPRFLRMVGLARQGLPRHGRERALRPLGDPGGRRPQFVREALAEADLAKHMVVPAPGITVGAVFHEVGVPHVGGIAGPTYLLVVSENGEMDKLDAELAARETGFYADVIRRLAGADAAELRSGDPTLGTGPCRRTIRARPRSAGPRTASWSTPARAGVSRYASTACVSATAACWSRSPPSEERRSRESPSSCAAATPSSRTPRH